MTVEGELGLFTDSGKHEMEIGRVSGGHWVGGIDMIEPAPAILGIRALTDGRLLTLSHARFMELRRSDPALTLKLLRTLSHELGIRLQEYSCRAIERPEPDGDREEGSEHHGWLKRLLGTFSGEGRPS